MTPFLDGLQFGLGAITGAGLTIAAGYYGVRWLIRRLVG